VGRAAARIAHGACASECRLAGSGIGRRGTPSGGQTTSGLSAGAMTGDTIYIDGGYHILG